MYTCRKLCSRTNTNQTVNGNKEDHLFVSIVVKLRDRHLEDHREVGFISFFQKLDLQSIEQVVSKVNYTIQ